MRLSLNTISKKILRVDPKLWKLSNVTAHLSCTFDVFFRKDHLCITYMQKSKSDVNPLTRYWQLKNTEIWLAESIFGYNLRTRFFPYMLFLQTISRQNWEIYFPKRKTPFDFLPENQVLTHTLSYGSLTPNKVSEKANVLVLTKLLKRRVDRWMDRWLTFT